MAASQDGKTFKQDMVVSIRYRNDLPPPPMPPKLLDIDTGGLSQYLTTSYASNLARRAEPNIDVDAEGGMPIDMIGMPGYFLGDESAIMAPEVAPVLDPEDAALMLSPEQLRAGGAKTDGHSFLRKTQYMSSANARANTEPLMPKNRIRKPQDNKNNASIARDDKENIKRHLQKGFDLAYPDSVAYNPPEAKAATITPAERDAWRMPVHPENPKLKPMAFYPVLPDLSAGTDGHGKWNYIKFDKPPLPANKDRRDDRIDAAILTGFPNESLTKVWQPKKDAFDRDPEHYEDPGPEPYVWSLHVPKHTDSTARIRRLLNEADPQKDNQEWLMELSEPGNEGEMRLPFSRARAYPNMKQLHVDSHKYMALVLHDATPNSQPARLRKQGSAAYYYPIMERDTLKSDRGKLGKSTRRGGDFGDNEDLTDNLPDEIMLRTVEQNAEQTYARKAFLGQYDDSYKEEFARLGRELEAEAQRSEAEKIEAEQGTLHKGAQDTDMAEVEVADQMEVVGNGPGEHADRDDDLREEMNGDRDSDADADMDE